MYQEFTPNSVQTKESIKKNRYLKVTVIKNIFKLSIKPLYEYIEIIKEKAKKLSISFKNYFFCCLLQFRPVYTIAILQEGFNKIMYHSQNTILFSDSFLSLIIVNVLHFKFFLYLHSNTSIIESKLL